MNNNHEADRERQTLPKMNCFEVIDARELAKRWSLPASWVAEQSRDRVTDPIPCVRLGKYVRFEWDSPELNAWWQRRRNWRKNCAFAVVR